MKYSITHLLLRKCPKICSPRLHTGPTCFLSDSLVNEVWLRVFKADFCFEMMHLGELLVRNIWGSLDTMSQQKFEFLGLLSFVLLKIPAIHEKVSFMAYSGLEGLKHQVYSGLEGLKHSLSK